MNRHSILHNDKAETRVRRSHGLRGFTATELLVVVGIIAIVGSLLLSSLSNARDKAHTISCLNHLRQLQFCWLMYAHDEDGSLPSQAWTNVNGQTLSLPGSWVLGDVRLDPTLHHITNGPLYSYNSTPKIYRCPGDSSHVEGTRIPRSRSYSMSGFFGVSERKLERIIDPAGTFVFLDEDETSIDDSVFRISPLGDWRWLDLPAHRHQNAANLTFADGHAATIKWKGTNVLERFGHPQPVDRGNNPDAYDLIRLQELNPQRPIPSSQAY